MLDARRFKGDEERFETSMSPFIIALLETLKGECPLLCAETKLASSPLSLSMDNSAYADAGDEPVEDA
jgi:hypothetical protein